MPLVQALVRVAASQNAETMILEAGKSPALARRGERIALAMPPLGSEMLDTILAEVQAEEVVLGYRARIEYGADGPVITLRRAEEGSAARRATLVAVPAAPTPAAPAPVRRPAPEVDSDLGTAGPGVVAPGGELAALLAEAAWRGAADLFLDAGRAVVRIEGELVELPDGGGALDELGRLVEPDRQAILDTTGSVDLALSSEGRRVRANLFRHVDGLAAALRLVDERGRSLAALGLPRELGALVRQPSGLVLVAGLAGHGKSTTLGALIDAIDEHAARHVITLEDPIERRFRPCRSLIHQREVGRDMESFAAGLRAALRESPDVIVVGEMRDPETIAAALTAADTGHLVLSTVHAATAATAIDRIIDGFAATRADAIRAQLAAVLRAVVAQRLVPTTSGGRAAAVELLQVTTAVASLIRDDRGHQLASSIQTGKAEGMIPLEASLARLVRAGQVTREHAVRSAVDRDHLVQLLGA